MNAMVFMLMSFECELVDGNDNNNNNRTEKKNKNELWGSHGVYLE